MAGTRQKTAPSQCEITESMSCLRKTSASEGIVSPDEGGGQLGQMKLY